MGFSSFRVNVVLRIAILTVLCFVLIWGWTQTQWRVTLLVAAALMIMGVVDLIRYVERTSRDLASFLTMVAHHDFSTPVFGAAKGRIFGQLQAAYRVLAGEFRRLDQQKIADHQLLEAIVEHLGVAMACFDEHGAVILMNAPARRLFRSPYLGSGRSFARVDPNLPDTLQQLPSGERTMVDISIGDENLRLVLYATDFELQQRRHRIVSFHDIRDELDQQEVESWQKLIRVLTHEIMNSVTPIISLSGLIKENLAETDPSAGQRIAAPEHDDLLRSVTAIHARSSGLRAFVQAYRSFANLPPPTLADVAIANLLERVAALMSEEANTRGVTLTVHCDDPTLQIRVDPQQIEQVALNLIHNAFDALADRDAAKIELRAATDDAGRVIVQIKDNGGGIDPAQLDDIFVPFFTTKREGMGVGLSISRRIMRINHGSITVRSTPNHGSVFTLRFRSNASRR